MNRPPSFPSVDRILNQSEVRENHLALLFKDTRERTRNILLGLAVALGLGVIGGGCHYLNQAEENTLIACQQMAKGKALNEAKYVDFFFQEDGPRFDLDGEQYRLIPPRLFHESGPLTEEQIQLIAEHCNTHYSYRLSPKLIRQVTAEDVRRAIGELE